MLCDLDLAIRLDQRYVCLKTAGSSAGRNSNFLQVARFVKVRLGTPPGAALIIREYRTGSDTGSAGFVVLLLLKGKAVLLASWLLGVGRPSLFAADMGDHAQPSLSWCRDTDSRLGPDARDFARIARRKYEATDSIYPLTNV
jgi:hypothetical protein